MSLWVISQILRLFVIIMISDDKYSFRNSENLQQRIQMHLFKEQNLFRIFLHDF